MILTRETLNGKMIVEFAFLYFVFYPILRKLLLLLKIDINKSKFKLKDKDKFEESKILLVAFLMFKTFSF